MRIAHCLILILVAAFFCQCANADIRPPAKQRKLYIVAIGIDKYLTGPPLHYCVDDAKALSEALASKSKGLYSGGVFIQALGNEQATAAGVESALESVIKKAEPDSTFVFHFSGSGSLDNKKEFYLATSDTKNLDDPSTFDLTISQLGATFSRINSRNQLIILDSCYSGSAIEALRERLVQRAERDGLGRNLAVVAVRGIAPESPEFHHGTLTKVLLDGLAGAADMDKDGQISSTELINYAETLGPKFSKILQIAEASYGDSFSLALAGKENDTAATSDATDLGDSRAVPGQTRAAAKEPMLTRDAVLEDDESGKSTLDSHGISKERRDYAVFFATKDYDDRKIRQLRNPVIDARTLAGVLEQMYGWKVQVVENPTCDEVLNVLRKYATQKYNDEDQLMVFFCGHGTFDSDFKLGYLGGRDSMADDPAHKTWISHTDILRYLQAAPCKHTLLVLDTCFGGKFEESIALELTSHRGTPALYGNLALERFYDLYFRGTPTRWFLAAGEHEVPDGIAGENSPLARRLIETLKVQGPKKGYLTRADINAAIQDVVSGPITDGFRGDGAASTFLFMLKPELKTKQ